MAAGNEGLYSDLRWLWCAGACTTQAGCRCAPVGISGSGADLFYGLSALQWGA